MHLLNIISLIPAPSSSCVIYLPGPSRRKHHLAHEVRDGRHVKRGDEHWAWGNSCRGFGRKEALRGLLAARAGSWAICLLFCSLFWYPTNRMWPCWGHRSAFSVYLRFLVANEAYFRITGTAGDRLFLMVTLYPDMCPIGELHTWSWWNPSNTDRIKEDQRACQQRPAERHRSCSTSAADVRLRR